MTDERDKVMIFRTSQRIICPGRPNCDCDATKRCGNCNRSKVTCDALEPCCADCRH